MGKMQVPPNMLALTHFCFRIFVYVYWNIFFLYWLWDVEVGVLCLVVALISWYDQETELEWSKASLRPFFGYLANEGLFLCVLIFCHVFISVARNYFYNDCFWLLFVGSRKELASALNSLALSVSRCYGEERVPGWYGSWKFCASFTSKHSHQIVSHPYLVSGDSMW